MGQNKTISKEQIELTKEDYIKKYEELKKECQNKAKQCDLTDAKIAFHILYNEKAKEEHIVGYYLHTYPTAALSRWESSLEIKMQRGEPISETEKKITELLKRLHYKGKGEEISGGEEYEKSKIL